MQPLIPVIEYHLYKESIIELFCIERELPQSDCDGVCYLSSQIAENQEKQSDFTNSNADFYPIAVQYAIAKNFRFYPESEQLTSFYFVNWTIPDITVTTPPPELS